jgi:hypothetical protein
MQWLQTQLRRVRQLHGIYVTLRSPKYASLYQYKFY